MNTIRIVASLILLCILSGCSDSSSKPTTYKIPKEPILTTDPDAPKMNNMASANLPQEALAQAIDPTWTQPTEWTSKAVNSIRRGSFAFGPNDEVDISITVFPGDVGGILANVNRWRNQIGLTPISEEELERITDEMSWNFFSGTYTKLEGPTITTLAAITESDSNSWFFKMTGPTELVLSQSDTFQNFLNTVQFPSNE